MSDARKRAGTMDKVVTITRADDRPAIHVGQCLVAVTNQLREVMRLTDHLDIDDEYVVAVNESLLNAGRDLLAAAAALERGLREEGVHPSPDQPLVS